jgi:hypothetical protein
MELPVTVGFIDKVVIIHRGQFAVYITSELQGDKFEIT